MNSLGKQELPSAFIKYIEDYKKLSFEYSKIPNWRWLKQFRNIKQRESLTRVFVAKTRKWDM